MLEGCHLRDQALPERLVDLRDDDDPLDADAALSGLVVAAERDAARRVGEVRGLKGSGLKSIK